MTAGLHELAGRRGPLLIQLPPGMQRDDERLDYFLRRVPAWMRPVLEFRHPSWSDDSVFALLERHGAAYCVMSGAALPCILRATSDIVYVRLHGPDPALVRGALTRPRIWRGGRNGSANGSEGRSRRCMPTSTTTAAETRSGCRGLARGVVAVIETLATAVLGFDRGRGGRSHRLGFAGAALAEEIVKATIVPTARNSDCQFCRVRFQKSGRRGSGARSTGVGPCCSCSALNTASRRATGRTRTRGR